MKTNKTLLSAITAASVAGVLSIAYAQSEPAPSPTSVQAPNTESSAQLQAWHDREQEREKAREIARQQALDAAEAQRAANEASVAQAQTTEPTYSANMSNTAVLAEPSQQAEPTAPATADPSGSQSSGTTATTPDPSYNSSTDNSSTSSQSSMPAPQADRN